MKILVIGAKGFIGSWCISLLGQRYDVWGCDIMNDYISEKYLQIGVTNSDFNKIFRDYEFDFCINCSGAASVPDSFKNPLKDLFLNTSNVANMLEAIRLNKPKCKFINLSSAAVYGNPKKIPINEKDTLNPLSPYGLHKKYSEEIVKEYAHFFNLKTCSLRLFSVYGPGLQKQLFWDVHRKIIASNKITLWGTGNESRDFIYIEDLINAIDCVIHNTNFAGECINVSDGIEITINEAIKTLHNVHYENFDFQFNGEQAQGFPKNWKADISLLKTFGYRPQFSLEQGLSNYVAWLKTEKR